MNVCVCVCISAREQISGCRDLDFLLVSWIRDFSLLVCVVYTACDIKAEQTCMSTLSTPCFSQRHHLETLHLPPLVLTKSYSAMHALPLFLRIKITS